MALDISQGGLNWVASMDINEFTRAILAMQRQLGQIDNQVQQSGARIDDYARRVSLAIGSYLSLNAAGSLIKQIVTVRGEFQQLEVAFSTMLQSKEKADALMAQAVELAATTPFDLQQVAQGAKQLLAYGFSADTVTDNLRMLGNIAAGVGAPLNDIVYLYGTLQTQGRAYTRDIMQFTSRGIPVIDLLAKQFGVAKDQVNELVESGKVGFPEIEKAFKTLTGSGGLFFNLMEEQSKTLTGQISNLKDAWIVMLNDIGKGQEGLAHDVLAAAKSIVENYQTVLDILKVLLVTYGAYKAAIITQTAVMSINANVVRIYTVQTRSLAVAQTLQATATNIANNAMKALNASMLANPAVLVAAAIGGLYLSYQKLREEMVQVKTSQELLAEASKDIFTEFAKQETAINQYVATLNNQNIAESVRLNAYNELNKLAPEILKGLTFQEAKTKDLTAATQAYIAVLRQRATVEGLQGAYSAALKQQEAARQQLIKYQNELKDLTGYAAATKGASNVRKAQEALNQAIETRRTIEAELALETGRGTEDAIRGRIRMLEQEQKYVDKNSIAYKEYEEQIIALRKSLASDNTVPEIKRTVAVIDEEIKKVQEEQKAVSQTSKQWNEFQKRLESLREERERITGATKSQLKSEESLENKVQAMLEKRMTLLQRIQSLQRDALQSGMLREQSEVDKIRETFEAATREIEKANKEITEFNEKNRGRRGFREVPLIGASTLNQLSAAQSAYITNTILKQDAQKYLESVELKKKAFEEFERIQLQGNNEITAQARKEYSTQIGAFDSYVDYLRAERDKVAMIIGFGGLDVGTQTAFTELSRKIAEAEKENDNRRIQQNIANYQQLLQATRTYNSERLAIAEKYAKLEATLNKEVLDTTSQEYQTRQAGLNSARQQEETDLKNGYARQSQLYKTLNQDIILQTRENLQERLELMEKWLKDGRVVDAQTGEVTELTPQMKADLENGIMQAKQFLNDTKEIFGVSVKRVRQIAEYAGTISQSFLSLSQVLQEVNSDLAATLETMGQIVGVAGDAAKAVASFTAGDIAGGISASVSAISGVISLFTSGKASEAAAKAQIEAFNQQILKGEVDINIAYRERLRLQAEINTLKIEGIEKEQKLLTEQRQQNIDDYNRILQLLQQQQYVIRQEEQKYGGVFGIGRKTRVVDVLGELTGLTYDQIEKLYMSGQLTDRAKELFEQLQKLNQEGISIEQQLQDLRDQANELYTGTTSESILDGIIDGFKNGLRSAADFADNFEDLMRDAVLNALKYQTLEKPLQDFYQQFADFSTDGLTGNEIDQLQAIYDKIIQDASKQFDNLQNITGVDLAGLSGNNSSLSGAVKGITEQQADLLAGQFGGLRLTAIQQLNIATRQLDSLNMIVDNTSHLLRIDDNIVRLERDGIRIRP